MSINLPFVLIHVRIIVNIIFEVNMSKLKVMILDDEPDLVEIFCCLFESKDIEITGFTDYQLAIEQSSNFDLIFIDLGIPKLRGDRIANLMDKSVPKILLTGNDNPEGLVFDFKQIIAKPYNSDVILKAFNCFGKK